MNRSSLKTAIRVGPFFDSFIEKFRTQARAFPDSRTGSNTSFTLDDIALSAFSVFFTQSPSFLSYQREMAEKIGRSNAQTIFKIDNIPSDNHIRKILDSVPPEALFPLYRENFSEFQKSPFFQDFNCLDGYYLIAFDGTWYFTSKKIRCESCSTKEYENDEITFHHQVLAPVIVAPGQKRAISLQPEFIVPQDGKDKQDCEMAAGHRWLEKYSSEYQPLGTIILGDDLFSKHPFCRKVLEKGHHFILVCKPTSHPVLYEWVTPVKASGEISTVKAQGWNGKFRETTTFRYMNNVPLRGTADALMVNWFEVLVECNGKVRYENSFITDFLVTDENVVELGACGRCRWKVENENFNTLKTHGYHLEHNFGHGKKNLAALLLAMNMLAFMCHTLLEMFDEKYRELRGQLKKRSTFFDHIRALTTYWCYESWSNLLDFMLKGLKTKHRLESG